MWLPGGVGSAGEVAAGGPGNASGDPAGRQPTGGLGIALDERAVRRYAVESIGGDG